MKTLIALCVSLSLVVGFSQAQIPMLTVAIQLDDVITLDPGRAFETTNATVHYATYETLLEIRPDDLNTVVPLLATGFTLSDDRLTYTFTLDPAARFASGSPVTAEDVRFSWMRLKNLKGSPAFYTDAIAAIDTPDERTVVVTLTTPTPAFPTLVTATAMSILEKAIVVANGGTDAPDADQTDTADAWLSQNSAGSGAYLLERWTPNREIVLTRNPAYWRDDPHFDLITLVDGLDSGTALGLLESGAVDLIDNLDPALANTVALDAALRLEVGQTLDLTIMAMSSNRAFQLPLSNRLVRRAIARAIDYDSIIRDLLSGYADRPASPLPIGIQGSNPGERYATSLDAARSLLDQAGYAGGFELTLSIGTGAPGGVPAEALAQKIAADLAQVGITVTLDQRPSAEFLAAFRAGELPFVIGTWTPDYLDATMWSDFFSFPDRGWAGRVGFDVPFIADLAARAANETNSALRTELYLQYQGAQVAEAVFIPLFQPQILYALRADVTGFAYHPVYRLSLPALAR